MTSTTQANRHLRDQIGNADLTRVSTTTFSIIDAVQRSQDGGGIFARNL